MWNSWNKVKRLEKAMAMRGLNPESFSLRGLLMVLEKRGAADKDLNPLVWNLIQFLEPPSCPMSHCEHYGCSGAPMNCSDGRVPGRCSILKAFKKRKAARESAKNPQPVPEA